MKGFFWYANYHSWIHHHLHICQLHLLLLISYLSSQRPWAANITSQSWCLHGFLGCLQCFWGKHTISIPRGTSVDLRFPTTVVLPWRRSTRIEIHWVRCCSHGYMVGSCNLWQSNISKNESISNTFKIWWKNTQMLFAFGYYLYVCSMEGVLYQSRFRINWHTDLWSQLHLPHDHLLDHGIAATLPWEWTDEPRGGLANCSWDSGNNARVQTMGGKLFPHSLYYLVYLWLNPANDGPHYPCYLLQKYSTGLQKHCGEWGIKKGYWWLIIPCCTLILARGTVVLGVVGRAMKKMDLSGPLWLGWLDNTETLWHEAFSFGAHHPQAPQQVFFLKNLALVHLQETEPIDTHLRCECRDEILHQRDLDVEQLGYYRW